MSRPSSMDSEPFPAISTAINIAAFVYSGCDELSSGPKVDRLASSSGDPRAERDLKRVAMEWQDARKQVGRGFRPISATDAAIVYIAHSCDSEASGIIAALDRVAGIRRAVEIRRADESRATEDLGKLEELRKADEAWKVQEMKQLEETQMADEVRKGEEMLITNEMKKRHGIRKAEEARIAEKRRELEELQQTHQIQRVEEAKKLKDIGQRLSDNRSGLPRHVVELLNDQQSSVSEKLQEMGDANSAIYYDSEDRVRLQPLEAALGQLRTFMQASTGRDFGESRDDALSHLRNVVRAGKVVAKEQAVLKSLQFPTMRERESTVAKAHAETFKWIFTDNCKFSHWLSSRSGIYWVSGKPGSGKSTLMRYIWGQTATRTALRSWAAGQTLIMANFYFSRLGTEMETSLHGLSQSLVFKILRQCPDLIPAVCPSRWVNAAEKSVEEAWTPQEIASVFRELMHQRNIDAKFCLFIDGLDEFEGQVGEMVDLLTNISKSQNIKLCLSSRPDNPFPGAFGRSPDRMLKLQDLTKDDIRRYARDKLEAHSVVVRLKDADRHYPALIEEIGKRADGVFLWVYLVVEDLKRGITNEDKVSVLQERLKALPSNLQEYFEHILSKVDRRYWKDTTLSFQMALEAKYTLPLWAFSVLDEDANFALETEVKGISAEEIDQQTATLTSRLNARCKGLLEAATTDSLDYPGLPKARFLHRTVRDFLMTKGVKERLNLERESFDAQDTICRGLLVQVKQLHIHRNDSFGKRSYLDTALKDLTYHAHRMEKNFGETPTQVLDECVRIIKESWYGRSAEEGQVSFYSYAVRQDLIPYLKRSLRENPNLISETPGQPLLSVALRSAANQGAGERYDYFLNPEMVQLLLDHGAKPNQRSNLPDELGLGFTVWTSFLSLLQKPGYPFQRRPCFRTIKMLLQADASRNLVLPEGGTLEAIFRKQFQPFEYKELERIMRELEAKSREPSDAPHAHSPNQISNPQISDEPSKKCPTALPIASQNPSGPPEESCPQPHGEEPLVEAQKTPSHKSKKSGQGTCTCCCLM